MGATDIGGMDSRDIIVVLMVIAGIVLVVTGVFQILRRYVFLKNRCTAQVGGDIFDKELSVKHSSNDSSDTVSYYVKYCYIVNGVAYTKRRSVSKGRYETTRKRENITVLYDPTKPKRHYVLQIKFYLIPTVSAIALGVVLLLCPLFIGQLG